MENNVSEKQMLLGKGTYGCVFRPGVNCQGKPAIDPQFVSKIEVKQSTNENEINIGKKIQSIPNYEDRFSPIIENCPIDIGTLDSQVIGECDIVRNGGPGPVELNKMKYVGKQSLANYLLTVLKENPRKFIEIWVESHLTLLDSLEVLNQTGIVHNDIKENNIMCRDEDGQPIIIDFGLSIDKESMFLPEPPSSQFQLFPASNRPGNRMPKHFFRYEPSYTVWCIDIHLLNYAMNVLNQGWLNSSITQEQINNVLDTPEFKKKYGEMFSTKINTSWTEALTQVTNDELFEKIYEKYGYAWRTLSVGDTAPIVNDFIEKNLLTSNLFTSEELEKYRLNLNDFMGKYTKQTWEVLINDLISYQESWDNYALSRTYLDMLHTYQLNEYEKMGKDYLTALKEVVLSLPNERKKPGETKGDLLKVLSIVPKPVHLNWIEKLFGAKANHSELNGKLAEKQLKEITRESSLHA